MGANNNDLLGDIAVRALHGECDLHASVQLGLSSIQNDPDKLQ